MITYIGDVRMFCGPKAPAGWRFCDGAELQIHEHTNLYAAIGEAYGGDGVSTFRLPDLRGRVPVHAGGAGVQRGTYGGAERVTLTDAHVPRHSHSLTVTTALASSPDPTGRTTAQSGSVQLYAPDDAQRAALAPGALTPAEGGGGAHENMPPFAVVGYIIAVEGLS